MTTSQEPNKNWSVDDSSIADEVRREDARSAPQPPFVGSSTPEEGGDATKDENLSGKGSGPLGTDIDLASGNRQKRTSGATIGTPRADEGLERDQENVTAV
jgi:hypothetical protein